MTRKLGARASRVLQKAVIPYMLCPDSECSLPFELVFLLGVLARLFLGLRDRAFLGLRERSALLGLRERGREGERLVRLALGEGLGVTFAGRPARKDAWRCGLCSFLICVKMWFLRCSRRNWLCLSLNVMPM